MQGRWSISRVGGTSNRYRRFLKSASLDIVITWAAYSMAFLTRAVTTPLDYLNGINAIVIISVINTLALYGFGIYQRIWSRTSGHGVVVIVNAMTVSTLVIIAGMTALQPRPLPLSVVVMGNVLTLVGFVAVRYRSRLISGLDWRWRAVWHHEFPNAQTRTLIIGAGIAGQELALRMKHHFPAASYTIVGFIDDDPEKKDMFVEGCRVLGSRHDISDVVERFKVELIVFAIHNISGPDFRAILSICEQTKALIKVVPDVYALFNARQGTTLLRDVQPEDLLGRGTVTRHASVDLAPVTHKVVLVTGAAGSIGSELSRQIIDYDPVRVILLDNNESGLHDLTVELQGCCPKIDICPALVDISDYSTLKRVFVAHRPQVVFHAAAYKHVPMLEYYPQEALRVNIRGTAHLLRLTREYGAERFAFISTDKAVNPSSIMGASKRIGELMLHASAQDNSRTLYTVVRFGNVLGSRGSVVPTFTRQIDHGGPVTITHSDMTRYFMSIPEAVNLIIHAACLTQGDDIYLLRMGEVVRIVELAERMIRMRGLRPYVDIDIVSTGIRPGEKIHEELYTSAETPIETIHPGIIQLVSWYNCFNKMIFWHHMEALLECTGDAQSVLREMLIVIDLSNGKQHNDALSSVHV